MRKKKHLILLISLAFLFVLLSGCSKASKDQERCIEDPLSYKGIPAEYRSAVQSFYEETGIAVSDPVHTVDNEDRKVMFFLADNKDDPDNPLLVSLSFCRDELGEYYDGQWYVGAYEIDDTKTCTHYKGDIPATFMSDPNFNYGCCWIAGPKNLLDEYYGDRVDKEIKIDDTYSVYIDEDEDGGIDNPTMQNIWAYYKEQGIIPEADV